MNKILNFIPWLASLEITMIEKSFYFLISIFTGWSEVFVAQRIAKNPNARARRSAIYILGQNKAKDGYSLQLVQEALHDNEREVREMAVSVIQWLGISDPGIINDALWSLDPKDENTTGILYFYRFKESVAAHVYNSQKRMRDIEKVLQDRDFQNSDFHAYAVRILGEIGNKEAVDILLRFFREKSYNTVREAMIDALVKIGGEEVIKGLVEIALDYDDLLLSGIYASRALAKLGQGYDYLNYYIEHGRDGDAKKKAAWALEALQNDKNL